MVYKSMSHPPHDKRKLLARVSRIQGQIAGIAKLLEQETDDCATVMQTIAATRGALNALMAELMGEHIRAHVIPEDATVSREQSEAAERVIDIINAYLR